jgi:hypothetical protein
MMISRRDSSQPVSFANGGERAECASDVRRRRFAPVRKEPHNESNKNEREPTSGRSTNYGSGDDARTRHAAKSTFCDRYHIVNERWSRFAGQFGGLAKVDSGFDYAANFSSFACLA